MSGPQVTWDASPAQAPQVKWDDEQKPAQPSFLDKEIPLDSYKNATLSGVQSIGRGFRGIGQAVAHPIESLKGMADIPKQVSQVPDAIHDINQSADPMGTYAKVGQETAGQGAAQAITALGTEGLAKAVPKVTGPAARGLYQSALKPSTTLGAARVGRMVDTGLDEGIPVSEGGVDKLGGKIGDVNDQINSTINAAPSRVVSKGKVLQRLNPVADRFSAQVNPQQT